MGDNLFRKVHDGYEEYLRDESRVTGNADTISFPTCDAEIFKVIKYNYDRGIPTTIQGARTGLAAGSIPNGGHIINLMKMDNILSIRMDDESNFYLTVQPGITLTQLREKIRTKKIDTSKFDDKSMEAYRAFLSSREMFFTPDPTEASATLGGMVACNASGARSYLYGSTRDHISALKVTLSDGETINIERGRNIAKGRKLSLITDNGKEIVIELPKYNMPHTKNTSGYYIKDNMDAIDLFIGSDGTLGIISEIEIKLRKLPKIIWGGMCFIKNTESLVEMVDSVRSKYDNIASIEYFDGNALEILRNQKSNNKAFKNLPEIIAGSTGAIYLELHTETETAAVEKLRNIGMLLEKLGESSSNTWVARNNFDKDKLYFFRHAVPESVNMLIDQRRKKYRNITKLGTDMAVPDKHLGKAIETYNRMLKIEGLESATWGHIGDNHLHVNILPNNQDEFDKGKAIHRVWAENIVKMEGAVSAEHGVGKTKTDMLRIMYGDRFISEMRKLKLQIDNKGILNRGNMFSIEEGELI
ncbi:FAD-binding oxidoreductase [Gudongella sp. DL1XJH-153]|uniref:FAD-binding oxidoreductase n=1 Tax=Gudongella sp. DL1XJH-153 TaxID=3409804 RepID=UPI003BB785CD